MHQVQIREMIPNQNIGPIRELLEQHAADKELHIPAYESQSISLAAYYGEQYVGGIMGTMVWRMLHIQYLAVDSAFRGHGIGIQLLQQIEQIAAEQGCIVSELTTMSWQAPEFYKKQGYTIFGEIANCPVEGQSRFYLKKEL